MSDIDMTEYRKVLGNLPTAVSLVASIVDDKPIGMAVGTLTSVSMEPPLIAFLPTRASYAWSQIRTAGRFAASILAADQRDLCLRFASRSAEKFDAVNWQRSPLGSPYIPTSLAWFDCTIADVVEAGDHYFVMGTVETMKVTRESSPLIFFRQAYHRPSEIEGASLSWF